MRKGYSRELYEWVIQGDDIERAGARDRSMHASGRDEVKGGEVRRCLEKRGK